MPPGWSAHDASAVLLADGELVAAVEEERLDRVKHSNFFPARAIRACLELAGLDWAAVDCVAVNFTERPTEVLPHDLGLPCIDLFLQDPSRRTVTVRDSLCDLFSTQLGADVSDKMFFCHHHMAHLWSAWWASSFARSLVVSLDGSGDGLSGMVAVASDEGLHVLREYTMAQSLGDFYSDTIRLLGYGRFDEYKAMGLAPYGDPRAYATLFDQFYELLPEGQYSLATRRERWNTLNQAGLVGQARRAGAPFTSVHKNIAASLQQSLEALATHVCEYFRVATQHTNLCLAGGVAHNLALTADCSTTAPSTGSSYNPRRTMPVAPLAPRSRRSTLKILARPARGRSRMSSGADRWAPTPTFEPHSSAGEAFWTSPERQTCRARSPP